MTSNSDNKVEHVVRLNFRVTSLQKKVESLQEIIKEKNDYLEATRKLLRKCKDSFYVLDVMEQTVHYHQAECDGYCLLEDITNNLESDND